VRRERMTSGWVLRKVKQNDKWVRRWLEVNRHVLYSYQACPAESAQARVGFSDDEAGVFEPRPVAGDQHARPEEDEGN